MDRSTLVRTRRLIVQGRQAGVYPAPPFQSSNPETVQFFVRLFASEMPEDGGLPPSLQRSLTDAKDEVGSGQRTSKVQSSMKRAIHQGMSWAATKCAVICGMLLALFAESRIGNVKGNESPPYRSLRVGIPY